MVEFINDAQFRQILNQIEQEYLISKTNPKGVITYSNDKFTKISGYTKYELIGKPHNIVRHPDMPKEVFKDLWHTIKNEKKPWNGFVKNKRKDGSHYWVLATIIPIFDEEDPDRIVEYISIRKEITEIMDHYEENIIFSKLYKIIDIYQNNAEKPLQTILQMILDEILTFEWLEVENKAGIMLWNEETQQLEMIVYKGVNDALLKMCNRVDLNQCLCGKAAALKQLVFKSHVDEDHNNHPAGMKPHGHYNVPLMFNNELQGVLFLYVEDGYKKRDIEVRFFNSLGFVLGSIIYRYRLEENLKKQNLNHFLFLQHLKRFSSKDTYYYSKENIFKENGNIEQKSIYYQEKYLHFLFLDVVNFTGFSENRSPLEVRNIINDLFSKIVQVIYEHKGDIDKFIGDAIFAYFDDAGNALKAGEGILEILKDPKKNPHQLKIRIGMHSGNAVHSEIGNDLRSDYTLIGDAVNTTQRIESAAKENQILVSEDFIKNLKEEDKKEIELSKKYKLKGKNKKQFINVYFINSVSKNKVVSL